MLPCDIAYVYTMDSALMALLVHSFLTRIRDRSTDSAYSFDQILKGRTLATLYGTSVTRERVKVATVSDEVIQKFTHFIERVIPEIRHELSNELQKYH